MTPAQQIPHGQLRVALFQLRDGDGPRLLLLHALGESSASWRDLAPAWPGPVLALDFAGHGASGWRPGGAYNPELFAADVDATLAVVGPCVLAGSGLGAYVALLVAGARPKLVPATLLLPGAGLAGFGAEPGAAPPLDLVEVLRRLDPQPGGAAVGADPATRSCEVDVRPPDYASAFGAAAQRLLLHEDDGERPPWWVALRDLPGATAVRGDRARAFADLAAVSARSSSPAL